jgi:hypothetical protein
MSKWSFAERFKSYMESRFAGQEDYSINRWAVYAKDNLTPIIQGYLENLPAYDDDETKADEQRRMVTRWTQRLQKAMSAAYTVDFSWDWTVGETNIVPRAEGICRRPTASLTTLSTSVISRTSSQSAATTTGLKPCLTDTECDLDCDDGDQPKCWHPSFVPGAIFGNCICQPKITTTSEASKTTAAPTTTTEALTTSEAATTTANPEPEPEPEPTPTADCHFWDEPFHWYFEINNIQGWAEDGGKSLEKEERGCGAIARWDWKDGHTSSVAFTLPLFMKEGCVERAIVSAGGPELQCDGHSSWDELSLMAAKNTSSPGQSTWKRPSFPERFKEVNRQAEGKYPHPPKGQHPQYVPMSWGSNSPTIK